MADLRSAPVDSAPIRPAQSQGWWQRLQRAWRAWNGEPEPELIALRAHTARLAQLQRNFIAGASHELRRPLTLLKAELDDVAHAPDLARALLRLGEAQQRLDTLEDLISQLIGMADLDAQLAESEQPKPTELTRLDDALFDAVTRCRLRYPATPVRVLFGAPDAGEEAPPANLPEPWVMGSRVLLAAAIKNGLSNAAKYSPPGSPAVVNLWLDGGQWRLCIRDLGVGIAPADLPHVFDLFYRGQTSAQATGSGVGLALIRRIVERLRGTVWIESDPQTSPGTALHLRFPTVAI